MEEAPQVEPTDAPQAEVTDDDTWLAGMLEGQMEPDLGDLEVPVVTLGTDGGGTIAPPETRIERFRRGAETLVEMLAFVREHMKDRRNEAWYEIGLRTAHAAEAFRFKEPDRAQSHLKRMAEVLRKIGLALPPQPTVAKLKALGTSVADQTWFAVGYNTSLFEEAIAHLEIERARSLIDAIVACFESLS